MSIWKRFKREIQLDAYYNPETDRIYNATPYTYTWYHERRHQEQYTKVRGLSRLGTQLYIGAYSLSGGIFIANLLAGLVAWDIVFSLIGFFWTPLVVLNSVLEIDAFIFGTYNWLKAF